MEDPYELRRRARRIREIAEQKMRIAEDLAAQVRGARNSKALCRLTDEFCDATDEIRKYVELSFRLELRARRADRERAAAGTPTPPPAPPGRTIH